MGVYTSPALASGLTALATLPGVSFTPGDSSYRSLPSGTAHATPHMCDSFSCGLLVVCYTTFYLFSPIGCFPPIHPSCSLPSPGISHFLDRSPSWLEEGPIPSGPVLFLFQIPHLCGPDPTVFSLQQIPVGFHGMHMMHFIQPRQAGLSHMLGFMVFSSYSWDGPCGLGSPYGSLVSTPRATSFQDLMSGSDSD